MSDQDAKPKSPEPAAPAAAPAGIPGAKTRKGDKNETSGQARIWEIDFLRGVAIILMVGYHILYDLGDMVGLGSFLGFSTNLSLRNWIIAQFFFAGLFVVLSGISSTLSRSNVRRGLRLLAVALLVTAATYVFDRSSTIHFGILHCLAVSILVYGLFFQKAGAAVCAAAGAGVIALSVAVPLALKGVPIRFDWLLPLGIHSPAYGSFDYFPLLPWLGIFLAGSAIGKSVYAAKRSLILWRLPSTFVNIAGRHSLLIYIVHQPIILGILYALRLVH